MKVSVNTDKNQLVIQAETPMDAFELGLLFRECTNKILVAHDSSDGPVLYFDLKPVEKPQDSKPIMTRHGPVGGP